MLQQAHLEEHQRRMRRVARRRRIHPVQCRFDGFPVQRTIQLFQKVVADRRSHETVQKAKLRISRRMHVFQTFIPSPRSNELRRDFEAFMLPRQYGWR